MITIISHIFYTFLANVIKELARRKLSWKLAVFELDYWVLSMFTFSAQKNILQEKETELNERHFLCLHSFQKVMTLHLFFPNGNRKAILNAYLLKENIFFSKLAYIIIKRFLWCLRKIILNLHLVSR